MQLVYFLKFDSIFNKYLLFLSFKKKFTLLELFEIMCIDIIYN